jgi:2-furoyl-CoA dehydrogenase FAD binding subunit
MKPRSFTYIRPADLEEAVEALDRLRDDARILAGGQSLVPMMNFRLVEAKVLVDISDLPSLAYVREQAGTIEIGTSTTQAQLMGWSRLAELAPLLSKAMPHVGHYQTRSRGTVCGSIAHSDPSSELPLCLTTLGGSVVLRSSSGTRVLSGDEFQIGMLTTARRPDEVVAAIRFPQRTAGTGYAFAEMARRHGDFAICALAAIVTADAVRLGVGGVADKPTVRTWPFLADGEIDDALNDFAWDLGGTDDAHATASYRRELVRRLGRRVIEEATNARTT